MHCLHNNSVKTALTLCLTLVLTGCSLFQSKPIPEDLDWSFTGKMALRNASEATSFNVDWLQIGEAYQISLYGPFGQGEITIKGQPGQVTLFQDDKKLTSTSLNGLLYEATSMDLPLDHIQYWVRAMPQPLETATVNKDAQGLVESIQQAGWQVTFSDYFEESSPRPRKLSFIKASDSGKLVIREWNPLPLTD